LFLAAVLVSTAFIDGLQIAWKVGTPFFLLLLLAYFLTSRRGGSASNDPLREELTARSELDASPDPAFGSGI